MPKYRKLAVVINAEHYDGSPESIQRILALGGNNQVDVFDSHLVIHTLAPGNEVDNDKDAWREYRRTSQHDRDYASARSAIPARLARKVDDFYDSLPKENKAVVYRYSNGDERNLNKSIRIGAELTTEQLHDIDRLSDVVADWPKYNGDVWRGMTFHSAKERYSFLSHPIRSRK